MKRTFTTALILAIGSIAIAQHDEPAIGKPKATIISQRDIDEKIDGKSTKATMVEVTLEPGQASMPHRHPGPVFGYIIEGEYEWAINQEPAKKLKAGDTFYEPNGCVHRVSRNPGTRKTRLVAVILHPRDVKEITVPVHKD